jgi:hypothetical protein
MHPNETLLRREYEARARRDDASLSAPHRRYRLARPRSQCDLGVYRGKAEVMEYLEA